MECTSTVLFPGGIRRMAGAENREISPSTGNLLLGSELPTSIQSSSGGAQLVELALPESWGKETETVQLHALFQLFEKITYVTLQPCCLHC